MFKRLAIQFSLALALTVPVLALAQPQAQVQTQTQSDAAASRAREPSIDDIYKAAESGKLSEADSMIAKVLAAHPGSAKAHFVHAELLAKEGKLGAAKTAYTKAEELAPGLPFAKPEAVAGLLKRIDGGGSSSGSTAESASRSAVGSSYASATPPAAEPSGLGTPAKAGIVVLLLAAGFFMFKRVSGARPGSNGTPVNPQAGYANPSYAGGATGYAPGSMAPASYPPNYPPAAPAPSATSGIGGALMTGAAMGLGAVAVEQAVRHFSQRDRPDDIVERRRDQPAFDNNLGPDTNADMGGSDFGVSDAGSWDSSGGGGGDSSSDW